MLTSINSKIHDLKYDQFFLSNVAKYLKIRFHHLSTLRELRHKRECMGARASVRECVQGHTQD